MDEFPPDLSRLGHELTSAIDRSLRRRQLRQQVVNRAVKAGLSGALIFVAMTPAVLQPASVLLADGQRLVPWPNNADTGTVARLCEPSQRNTAPVCNDPQVVVAAFHRAATGRIGQGFFWGPAQARAQ